MAMSRVSQNPIMVVLTAAAAGMVSLAMQPVAPMAVISGNHSPDALRMNGPQMAPAGQQLQMAAILKLSDPAGLDQLLRDQQNPRSPLYRHWLAKGEFAARFGLNQSEYAPVASWLKSQGFSVGAPDFTRRALPFTGTVGTAEKSFGVKIVTVDHGVHYGNVNDPSVPAALAGTIGFIDGLDNLRAARPAPLEFTAGSPEGNQSSVRPLQITQLLSGGPAIGSSPQYELNGEIGFAPSDMYTFYDETPLLQGKINGSGVGCIGLIEAGDFDDQDESNFNKAFGLPPAVITRILADGTNPGMNYRSFETIFDINWSHSIAPGAPLNVYLGSIKAADGDPTLASLDALRQAVADNSCGVLSISIESCGYPNSFFTEFVDPLYAQAAAQGQTVFVAIGDQGAAEYFVNPVTGQCTGANGIFRIVSEIAADPNIVSVGGTQFKPIYDSNHNNVGFVPEAAWNEPDQIASAIGSTGGGFSQIWPKPFYQNGLTPADNARDVPDISMEAACAHPGVFTVFDHKVGCCSCGTSLGAPVWAGITKLLNQYYGQQRLGNLDPALYQLGAQASTPQTGVRDTTLGNNDFNGVVGFEAQPGYDQATGWGTPDITQFVRNFANTPLPGQISAPASFSFGIVKAGDLDLNTLTIRNTAAAGILHGSVAAPTLPFALFPGGGSFSIGPGQSTRLPIGFAPSAAGSYRQLLQIASDDPTHPLTAIILTGQGK
jgi:trimeric autotransporter adhesin